MRCRKSLSTPYRRGFTMVELITVVAIVGVLATLTTAGVWIAVGGRRQANTESTIRAINQVLQHQWSQVIAEAKKESPSSAVVSLAGTDPGGQRAQVIWIKCRLAEAFPTSYAEINNPPVYAANYIPAGSRRYNATYKTTIGGRVAGSAQSSACLLIALSISRGGTSLTPDLLGSALNDVDNDGLKEIVDGWNFPMQFIRFDWNDANLQAVNPAIGGKPPDPVDPNGLLLNAAWYNAHGKAFEATLGYQIHGTGGAPNYVLPVIISGGADNTVGTSDDIFSYNLRAQP